ncbi:Gamma-aminobutyric acid receptor-associated protein-like 2 [Galemys pyrenaicus]|uniref:Gamma-aminobutyric acid receptor-associated protein-like 2 n=1 Tax=Galemys pyrenaicus TaxID=202257 RepID=A0A8J6A824_GALPY|nr:Gamma-aminobutyric acid receptor-associated protein-like 2 [Galemys pyrenaicus]
MKWMFKEDHSLGKRSATGRAGGVGRWVTPSPTRAALGRAGQGGCRSGLGSQGTGTRDGRPRTLCRPPQAVPGASEQRAAAGGTPERGSGSCAGRGGRRAEDREPAGGPDPPSSRCVSPVEHRCVESAKIRAKYPDRVPVIVEKVSGSQIVDIDKRKYLVPSDITVAQFMWIIRKRIQLPSEKAIFLFVDKTVPQSSLTMGQLYEKEKDEDGFLYVAYSGENTFGF